MIRQRLVFVLRLWTESPATGADLRPQLRGSLQPVDAEQVYYFRSWDQMVDHVRGMLRWDETAIESPSEK